MITWAIVYLATHSDIHWVAILVLLGGAMMCDTVILGQLAESIGKWGRK